MKHRFFLYGWMTAVAVGLVILNLCLLRIITLPPEPVAGEGEAPVTITAPATTDDTASPAIPDHVHFLTVCLIMSLGALGAHVQALISFADYIGNRQFRKSWTFFYVKRPFVGATIALLTFAALRGGFADGGVSDTLRSGGLWGTIAISLIAGLFSRQAMDKIGKVFDVVFAGGRMPRKDGLDPAPLAATPVLVSSTPESISRKAETVLTLSGDSFSESTIIRSGESDLDGELVSETQFKVTIPADFVDPESDELTVTAVNPDADPDESKPLSIPVTD